MAEPRDLTPREKRIAEDLARERGLPPEKGVAIIRSWLQLKAGLRPKPEGEPASD